MSYNKGNYVMKSEVKYFLRKVSAEKFAESYFYKIKYNSINFLNQLGHVFK